MGDITSPYQGGSGRLSPDLVVLTRITIVLLFGCHVTWVGGGGAGKTVSVFQDEEDVTKGLLIFAQTTTSTAKQVLLPQQRGQSGVAQSKIVGSVQSDVESGIKLT